jgi:hypothetical protein
MILSRMTLKLRLAAAVLFAAIQLAPWACAQDPVAGSTAGEQQSAQPEENSGKLTIDEQLKIRAAQQKASEDPAVKAALEKRNQAIEDLRVALHNGMVKADPRVEPILAKIAVGKSPGF